jgi:hypothetical protein
MKRSLDAGAAVVAGIRSGGAVIAATGGGRSCRQPRVSPSGQPRVARALYGVPHSERA